MAISSISDEVLVSEIFLRLPASCIVTLRSVCRSWRRLTTEPSFVRAHLFARLADAGAVSAEPLVYQLTGRTVENGELRMLKLDAHDADNVIGTFKIPMIPGSGPILHLIASCDGLLCFQPYDDEEEKKHCYVCNPVTRIWTTVPASARAAVCQDPVCFYHRHVLGFYFHRSTGEYRLLYYWSNYIGDRAPFWMEGAYEVAAVGGEDKSWRSVRELRVTQDRAYNAAKDYDAAEVLGAYGYRTHGSITVNGRLHWLHSALADKLGVVAFDTESETFSRISAPIGPHDDLHPFAFKMNKILGNLCLGLMTKNRYGEETMELWMLKDYATQQWVKLHTIRPDRRGFMRTLPHDNQEGDGLMMVRWDTKSFAIYNFKLKTYKQITITSDQLGITDASSNFHGNNFIYYRESLVDPRTNLS